ncbi:A24 family peptidase [Comamonadaceae bacterium PP-2]
MFIQLWLLAVMVCDLRWRRVPNWLVLVGFLGWLFAGNGLTDSISWLGALAAFFILIPFYMLRWMGAGDVKFGVIVGLWLGLSMDLCWVWVGGSLLAGLHSVLSYAVAAVQRRVEVKAMLLSLGLHRWVESGDDRAGHTELNFPMLWNKTDEVKRVIPYAAYMAVVAFFLILKS